MGFSRMRGMKRRLLEVDTLGSQSLIVLSADVNNAA